MLVVWVIFLLDLSLVCVDGGKSSGAYHGSYSYHGTYLDRREIHANMDNIVTNQKNISSNLQKFESLKTNIARNISQLNIQINQNVTKQFAQVQNNLLNIQNIFQTKDQSLEGRLSKLETRIKVDYAHCRSLPDSTCGPCLCFDDYMLSQRYYCDCQNLPLKRDCLEYFTSGVRVNGVYKVTMNNLKIMQVYCDQTSDGGGWTVFQRRYDGSTDFYRHWEAYVDGFGTLQHEFWLGNENIHVLTMQSMLPKGTELRIDLKSAESGKRYFAKYRHFQINNKFLNYMLLVYGYSGNAGDYLSPQSGKFFSTYDKDQDMDSKRHCARVYLGGWWFSDCGVSNLNGFFAKSSEMNATDRIYWKGLENSAALNFVEMKARRVT